MEEKKEKMGLFIACYEIGGDKPGAPLLRVNLVFNAPEHKVSGMGHLTQAVNPPVDIPTRLHGKYTYMKVMGKPPWILITLEGETLALPPHPNVELQIVLEPDWKSGQAHYKYLLNGEWSPEIEAPVKSVPCNTV